MRSRTEGIIIIFCGLVFIAAACFVYFTALPVYPDTDSPRVRDLNRVLRLFGKTGTAVLFIAPGLIAIYIGWWKMKKS